jgi:hypothetical protein
MRPLVLGMALAMIGCATPPVPDPDIASAKFIFEFAKFTEGDPWIHPPRRPSVYVTIRKDDPDAGPVTWGGIHREGDLVGWSEESGVVTSVHVVPSVRLKKQVPVSFDTGVFIERIVVNDIESKKAKNCPIIREPMLECPGPQPAVSVWRMDEVHYKDRNGTPASYRMSTVLSDRDEVCVDHGGPYKPRWSPEKLKETLEALAMPVLHEADANWLSKNPKLRSRARDAYRDLLKKYYPADLVTRNWDRIKSRSEAEIDD